MPPGPVFNWLTVAHSALEILDHALKYRAAQVTRAGGVCASQNQQQHTRDAYEEKKGKTGVEESVTLAN
ncbi:hypothetical protein B0F90DRAFT_1752785, partial [Multifurca ochricompacta]